MARVGECPACHEPDVELVQFGGGIMRAEVCTGCVATGKRALKIGRYLMKLLG